MVASTPRGENARLLGDDQLASKNSRSMVKLPDAEKGDSLCGSPGANSLGANVNLTPTLVASTGCMLEFFDFAVFGFFANIISEQFFPPGDKTFALAETFAVFAGAFCMRPLGGILFGYIGDTYGRSHAVKLSIGMMAVATFLMGCLPTYSQIGAWAPTLLMLTRSIQGLSTGGQLVGGMLFAVENAPEKHSGVMGAIVMASITLGTAGGSGVASLLRNVMSPETLSSWGWRVPFWCGIAVGVIGFMGKDHIHDPEPAGESLPQPKDKKRENPLMVAVTKHWRELLVIAGVCTYFTCSFALIMVWVVTYETTIVRAAQVASGAFRINTLVSVVAAVAAFVPFGYLGDRVGANRVMITSICIAIVVAFPAYDQLGMGTSFSMICGQTLLLGPVCAYGANLPAWIIRRCPASCRYTLLGLAYNIANAVFGGTAPLVATMLLRPDLKIPISLFPKMATPLAMYHMCVAMLGLGVLLLDMYVCKRVPLRVKDVA